MNTPLDANWYNQLQNALGALGTPAGMIGAMFLLTLFFLSISSRSARLFAMALMMWAASLGYYGLGRALISPLEQIRANGRGITTALLFLLVIPALAGTKGSRKRTIARAALAFFIFQCIFTFCEVVTGQQIGASGLGRFMLGGVLFFVTFLVLGYGLPRWIHSLDEFHQVVTFLGVAATIFCGATFAQVMVNRSVVLDGGGRLMGTTGNPQHCAVVLGLCITPLAYLVSQPYQSLYKRIFFGCVAGLTGIFLLWTGSRTGNLMGLAGLMVMYRARMGRGLMAGCFAAVFVLIFLEIFSGVNIFSSHLVSSEDTRTGVWQFQLQQFLHSPIIGQNLGTFGYSENSYLATAARYGLLGLIPLGVMLYFAGKSMIQLHRSRPYMGDFTLAADMVLGSLVSLAIGAWFEAYLLGTLTFMIYLIYIDFALMNALIDLAEAPIPDTQAQGFDISYQFAETA